jgi:hypothetical protein
VSDVRVQFGPTALVKLRLMRPHARSAVVAVLCAQVILAPATRTTGGQLPARHRDEQSFGSAYDLQVTDHETAVEGDSCEPL